MFKINNLSYTCYTVNNNFVFFDWYSNSNSGVALVKDLLVFEKLKKNFLFSTYYKPKKINFEKKVYTKEEKIKFVDFFKKKKSTNIFKLKVKSLKKFIFSKLKFKFRKKDVISFKPLKKIQINTFLKKLVFGFSKFPKFVWKSLLITMSDVKMWAMLDYYDYFGLITTARNYICVHSDLTINKSLLNLKSLSSKTLNINIYAKKVIKKMLSKKLKFKKWFFRNFRFLSFKKLEWKMFDNFYRPFCTTQFEKTDQLQRSFFLDKYLIYRKLLPNATKDFFGYISKTTKAQNFLYNHTYQMSSIFFWNFISFFLKKKKRILSFKNYKSKLLLKRFLFSYFNISTNKLISNRLNKRTDTQFHHPFFFFNSFFKKIFENKSNWIDFSLKGNEKSVNSSSKLFRKLFGLFWSTAKKFIWKSKEYNLYSKIDYFTKAKYVRKDLVIDSFLPEVWKDFKSLANKLSYNSLNFNFRKLLRTLLPKQKLIEYNLLRSNSLYNFLDILTVNRKFFSILKIFWKDWDRKEEPLSSYNLSFPINFDVDKHLFYENLTIFIRELGLTQVYFTPAYELPFNYYKENFYDNKKWKGFEFFFSNRLILAATTIWFPVLLNCWMFRDNYCIVFIPRPDSLTISEIKEQSAKIDNLVNKTYSTKLSNYSNKLKNDTFNLRNIIAKIVLKSKFRNDIFLKLFSLIKNNFFKDNLSSLSSSFFFLFFLNYIYFKSLKKKSFSTLTFGYQMIWFFNESIKFETFFNTDPSNTYAAFAQTTWLEQKNPVTFFRINGYKKRKTNGEVTAIAFNFNTLAPGIHYAITHDRINPSFLSADDRKQNTYKVMRATFTSELAYFQAKLPLTLMFYDNLKEQLINSTKFFFTLNFKNSTAFSTYKSLLSDIIPYSIMEHISFRYWFSYLTIFENRSVNFLTSKTRRTSKLINYFFGPINISLFLENNVLLSSKSWSIFKHFSALTTFSILEAQALKFPELVFKLQFDYKKLNLGRSFELLDSYHDQSFFHFLKTDILSDYMDFNFLEMHCLSVLSNNFCLNSIRFQETEKFQFSFLDDSMKFDYFLPTAMLNEELVRHYKIRWSYYGFPEIIGKAPFIYKNFWSSLNLTSYLSRFLVFSEQTFFFLPYINMEHISLELSNKNFYFTNNLSPTFLFKNEFLKIHYLKLSEDPNNLLDFHSMRAKLSLYQQSNLYLFPSMLNGINIFNYSSKVFNSANQPFFSKILNYHYSTNSKYFFLKNIWTTYSSFNEVFFYGKALVTPLILEKFKFKSKFKTLKSLPNRSSFAKSFLLAKSFFNLYFSKFYIFLKYTKIFFKKNLKKFLFLLRLVISSTFFSNFSLYFLFFIFYFLFFILKKNNIFLKNLNNSVLGNLFISMKNYFFITKTKFSLITLVPINLFKTIRLVPMLLKDIAKKKIHRIQIKKKNEKLFQLKKFFFLEKKNFYYEKTLIFFFFFFFRTFFFSSTDKNFFLLKDSTYKANNYLYFFEIQLLKELSKFLSFNDKPLLITTNKSFFLQSTTEKLTSLINQFDENFDPTMLNEKLTLLVSYFQKRKILKNFSFFWYGYTNYFNRSLKYFLNFIPNKYNNKERMCESKIAFNFLNYEFWGWAVDVFKAKKYVYLTLIAKKSLKLNRFYFFKNLVERFTNINTNGVYQDHGKLRLTKKSNHLILSEFSDSKIKYSLNRFIDYVTTHIKISLKEKIFNTYVYNLQLYYSYVTCNWKGESLGFYNFNFKNFLLQLLIKNFYIFRKNKLFFSKENNFYISMLHNIRNFKKIIQNYGSKNFPIINNFGIKKKLLKSWIEKKASYNLKNFMFLLQALPWFQILSNFLNLNKDYSANSFNLKFYIINIFTFLSLNVFKELNYLKNNSGFFLLKLILGIFMFFKKNILLILNQKKNVFILKHKNISMPSFSNLQLRKNSSFHFLHFNIKSLIMLNYSYNDFIELHHKLYLSNGFNLIDNLKEYEPKLNKALLNSYNFKQLIKLNDNLIYNSYYSDFKQTFLQKFFFIGYLFYKFIISS